MITIIVSHFTIENENLSQELQSVSEPGYEVASFPVAEKSEGYEATWGGGGGRWYGIPSLYCRQS